MPHYLVKVKKDLPLSSSWTAHLVFDVSDDEEAMGVWKQEHPRMKFTEIISKKIDSKTFLVY